MPPDWEFSPPVWRFGTRPTPESMGYFETCPTPQPAKHPTFNASFAAPELLFMPAQNEYMVKYF
jgi:hypothetical protein